MERCAVCTTNRKRCRANCIYRIHFPRNQPDRYRLVNQVFGIAKLRYLINRVPGGNQIGAVEAMVRDAAERAANPLGGCWARIRSLEERISVLEAAQAAQVDEAAEAEDDHQDEAALVDEAAEAEEDHQDEAALAAQVDEAAEAEEDHQDEADLAAQVDVAAEAEEDHQDEADLAAQVDEAAEPAQVAQVDEAAEAEEDHQAEAVPAQAAQVDAESAEVAQALLMLPFLREHV